MNEPVDTSALRALAEFANTDNPWWGNVLGGVCFVLLVLMVLAVFGALIAASIWRPGKPVELPPDRPDIDALMREHMRITVEATERAVAESLEERDV